MDTLRLLVIEDDADQRDLICETIRDSFGGAAIMVGVGSKKEPWRRISPHSIDFCRITTCRTPPGWKCWRRCGFVAARR